MKFGRYNALTKLGQGAMATVYLAEDPALNRMVAIKVIHSHLSSNASLLDRFTVEAKTAAGLRNPNIVEIFDYGMEDDAQYLVMEYIDGPNLQFVLNLLGGQPMAPEIVAAVLCQAADGLGTADKFGVVHRDIKPENMMFTSDGVLKIADFGIAHISEQNMTQTGSILGSPNFMSPEQIDGKKPTHMTDMFSLGSVFYYCLSGRKPFTGPNIPTIMRNICDMPHPSLGTIIPDVDPVLENLVETLLQKDPANRGKGARWLSLQLRTYLNQKGILDPQEATKGFLEQVGQMGGNQTVVDMSAPPTPDEATPTRSKQPMTPGMKVEKPRTAKPGAGSGSGIQPGSGIRSGSGVRPGSTWQQGGRTGSDDMDFSGARPPSKGRNLGLIIGGGALAVVLLVVALIVVLHGGGNSPTPAQDKTQQAADQGNGNVTPSAAVASISLQPASMEIQAGQKRKFMIEVLPAGSPNGVRWESNDPSVAYVQDGEVWAQNPGQTTIRAISLQDGTKQASAEIIVSAAVVSGAGQAGRQGGNTGKTGGDSRPGQASNQERPRPVKQPIEQQNQSADNDDAARAFVDKPAEKAPAEKAPTNKAILTVTSAPPFAEVIVDGRFIGTTPVKDKELPTGKHKLQVTHRSFPAVDTTVMLGPGEKTLRFRLFR